MRAVRGFTLAELTIVMLITGVLAAVAVPRLFDKNEFAARAAHDFIVSGMRYGQKAAIAMRRNVCVAVSGATLSATYASAANANQPCDPANALMHPANGLPYADASNALPGGSTVASAASVIFDASGRPLSAPSTAVTSAISISVNGYAPAITIEPETGLVY
jgi:MSHA pilin protein MshC